MTTECNPIDQVIELSLEAGNLIAYQPNHRDECGRLVIWMNDPLTLELKTKMDALNLKLNFWTFEGVPHNPGASGYKCIECNIVVAFPDKRTPRIKTYKKYD